MRLTDKAINDTEKQFVTNRYLIYCRKSSESDERQVQSLTDQINTIIPFIQQRGLTIVGEPFQESKSAKSPGRPLFNQMVDTIEKGLANGIILLNPSRLSRNTVDTGKIIFLMDQGKLEEVVTPYQTFKNNPYDKFMLNLLCTQAKLENDNKSVNVKDSLRLKAERGDFPGKAPAGYINNSAKNQGLRDISAHPIYFPLMRKLIDFALTGNYSVESLRKKAEELGIRNINGKVICKSSMHRCLRDPFYAGRFVYKGKVYKGNHPALMSDEEFNLLQKILEGKSKGKFQKHEFALNGIIKCGECQYCVTAETHTKKYKSGKLQTFAYYRCSKKSKTIKCSQPYISDKSLEEQILENLSKLELERKFAEWAFEALEEVKSKDQNITEDKQKAIQAALDGVNKRINNLVELKISPNNTDGSLLSDEEFANRKRSLLAEKEKISKQLNNKGVSDDWNTENDSFDFALKACERFKNGYSQDQKTIIKTVGSNLILLHHKLQFQLRFLFIKYKEGIEKTKHEIARLEPSISISEQANLKNSVKNFIWYPRPDSNR